MKGERLKEKLGKQDFHYNLEENFEPVTAKQADAIKNQTQLSEKPLQVIGQQTQAVRDSSQTTVLSNRNSKQVFQKSSNTFNNILQKSIKDYDEITNRNNQLVTNLVNSNQVDFSIVRTVSKLPNDKHKSQFSLQPVEGNSNLFLIHPTNPQLVQIKSSTMTFQNGNTYNLNDSDLSYFVTNTQIEKNTKREPNL